MSSGPYGVQHIRKAGFQLPPNTVLVTRPGKFGNPYPVTRHRTAEEAVFYYEEWLLRGFVPPDHTYLQEIKLRIDRQIILEHLPWLAGKNLACFCKLDAPCHRNVLLRFANPGLFIRKGDGWVRTTG